MEVTRAMSRNVNTLPPSANIREVAEEMRNHNVGCIPICEYGYPLGMITDRDIAVRAIPAGQSLDRLPVREFMTTSVATINQHKDLIHAAEIMRQRQIRRLIVVDDDGKLTGLLTLDDLASCCDDPLLVASTLKATSEPAMIHG
jgi:CBS domain-containing protein